jgi:hypothetical protein
MDKKIEDALDAMKNDVDAIKVLMERDGLSKEEARELWHRMIETVKKLKRTFEGEESS